jgi:hypothetical protein
MVLRLVQDDPSFTLEGTSPRERPKDDKGFTDLLGRFTLGSGNRKFLLRPDEATLLTWAFRGKVFKEEDLAHIETWMREMDWYGPGSLRQHLEVLGEYVREELVRVSKDAWLRTPLEQFDRMVTDTVRRHGAVVSDRRILRAMFVVITTMRSA